MAQTCAVLILSLLALASPLRASRPAPDAVLEPGSGLLQANVDTFVSEGNSTSFYLFFFFFDSCGNVAFQL